MHVEPYLFFGGRCEEASEFYREAVGAQILCKMRFKESPEPPPPGTPTPDPEKIMHMSFKIGDSTIMASDGCGSVNVTFQGVSLTITVNTPEEADKVFQALAAGGTVGMPLSATFFSPRFGMLTDKFGLSWTVITEVSQTS